MFPFPKICIFPIENFHCKCANSQPGELFAQEKIMKKGFLCLGPHQVFFVVFEAGGAVCRVSRLQVTPTDTVPNYTTYYLSTHAPPQVVFITFSWTQLTWSQFVCLWLIAPASHQLFSSKFLHSSHIPNSMFPSHFFHIPSNFFRSRVSASSSIITLAAMTGNEYFVVNGISLKEFVLQTFT